MHRFVLPAYKSQVFLFALLAFGCNGAPSENEGKKTAARPTGGESQVSAGEAPADKEAAPPAEKSPAEKSPTEKKAGHKKHQHGAAKANRLAQETSPYLLMHAHNPVDWYPWGEEALAKAKAEHKPIFLSVGYSSCHWCHVMERESFLDEEISAFLNEHFVCIKVDREERPDIDSIYMTSLQMYNRLTQSGGGGGWPMSIFLTPDALPFFCGSYFPARDNDRPGMPGFLTLLRRIEEAWQDSPQSIERDAGVLTRVVRDQLRQTELAGAKKIPLDQNISQRVLEALSKQFDAEHGGFGYSAADPSRPKFPEPSNLFFLVDRAQENDEKAQAMLVRTLEAMAAGGMRDHLGGGFHRYSVDRFWRIPHFEKMLYDNGQLVSVYAEAHALADRQDFRRVAEEILAFVQREMTAPQGGFYAALDAESEGEEGEFYRWKKDEVQALLSDEEFSLFAEVYGFDQPPNFEGFYVPQFSRPLSQIAAGLNETESELEKKLAPIREKLLAARDKRPRPLTDSKILTGWNGLMIRGFADAGRIFKNEEYLAAAERAASFVLENLRGPDGRLRRTFGKGQARLNAYLDDYAFFVNGLLALHRATGKEQWLQAAKELTDVQLKHYEDQEHGGFFFTSDDHEKLLVREKNPVDGARPSGNTLAAENLIYLANALEQPELLEKARRTAEFTARYLEASPGLSPRMASVIARLAETPKKETE